ncbi:MAG: c-type cytochrome [Actinobacteria bacterium]|nr:c-type cytochrome [Actinomycetota bacterium]
MAASAGEGKASFASTCGGCHTLKDAGTKGAAGPNFDDLKPDKAKVAAAIEKGGTGSGAMPKGLLTGDKADQVAEYVSSVAGK